MIGYLAGMSWDVEAGIGAVALQNGPGGAPNALTRALIRQARAASEGRDPAVATMADLIGVAEPSDDADGATAAPTPSDPTPEQAVVIGAWRSHDPWTPYFRVEARGAETGAWRGEVRQKH